MKISLVIPTRSRAEYLRACLGSAVVAAGRAGCAVEILVSDNASDDDTEAVVRGFSHPAVRYIRQPRRLSMRMNFEAALGETTGSHIVFIGDDDGVLPNGLSLLRRIIETTGADAVNWRIVGFSWPDPAAGAAGNMTVRPPKLTGRMRRYDPEEIIARITSGRFRGYHDGVVTYHGCVSRALVDRARATSDGVYFWCSAPDVFGSMRNLMVPGITAMRVDLPITLGGQSPRSNGAASKRSGRRDGDPSDAEFVRFIAEAEADPCNGRLPTSCPSVSLMTLDALQMAMKFHGRNDPIDREAWLERIAGEVRGMTPANHAACEAHAALLLGGEVRFPASPPLPVTSRRANREAALRGWPTRAGLVGGADLEDVAGASRMLDRICRLDAALPPPRSGIGRTMRGMGVAIRARHEVKRIEAGTVLTPPVGNSTQATSGK